MQDFLSERLSEREEQGSLRKLSAENSLIDFSSNDYLGFACSEEFYFEVQKELSALDTPRSGLFGSTGSRLLTGNTI